MVGQDMLHGGVGFFFVYFVWTILDALEIGEHRRWSLITVCFVSGGVAFGLIGSEWTRNPVIEWFAVLLLGLALGFLWYANRGPSHRAFRLPAMPVYATIVIILMFLLGASLAWWNLKVSLGIFMMVAAILLGYCKVEPKKARSSATW